MALESYRKALAISQKLPETGQYDLPGQGLTSTLELQAIISLNMGAVLLQTGKLAHALESFRTASAIAEKLAKANPANMSVQQLLALSYHDIGHVLRRIGKPTEALEAHGKALAIVQKLTDAKPAVAGFQMYLAGSYNNIGLACRSRANGRAGRPGWWPGRGRGTWRLRGGRWSRPRSGGRSRPAASCRSAPPPPRAGCWRLAWIRARSPRSPRGARARPRRTRSRRGPGRRRV